MCLTLPCIKAVYCPIHKKSTHHLIRMRISSMSDQCSSCAHYDVIVYRASLSLYENLTLPNAKASLLLDNAPVPPTPQKVIRHSVFFSSPKVAQELDGCILEPGWRVGRLYTQQKQPPSVRWIKSYPDFWYLLCPFLSTSPGWNRIEKSFTVV